MMPNSWLASVRTGLIAHPDLRAGFVRVECPVGFCDFQHSSADVFDGKHLTISDSDGLELRTFAPGTWVNASEHDSRGNIRYAFFAGQPAESRNAS